MTRSMPIYGFGTGIYKAQRALIRSLSRASLARKTPRARMNCLPGKPGGGKVSVGEMLAGEMSVGRAGYFEAKTMQKRWPIGMNLSGNMASCPVTPCLAFSGSLARKPIVDKAGSEHHFGVNETLRESTRKTITELKFTYQTRDLT